MNVGTAKEWKVYQNLEGLPGNSAVRRDREAEEYGELLDILDNQKIYPVFQPVVSLMQGTVIGYEALSRGPAGSPMESPACLFGAAEKYGLVWELEYLCRMKALEKAGKYLQEKMLFLNVDPNIIKDPRFCRGWTLDMLEAFQVSASRIIFEITEKTAVQDYDSFRVILDNYVSQGYKIAIDDTGAGYSGLQLLARVNPHFIKVDMDLVRNIDRDLVKQAMLRSLQGYAEVTDSKIIAEGVETWGELQTLIQIGVAYAQGYYIQRPDTEFREIDSLIRESIVEENQRKKKMVFYTPATAPIGVLASRDPAFPVDTPGSHIAEYLAHHPNVRSVPVVEGDYICGLVSKDLLKGHMGTLYGISLYMQRPVAMLMERKPLVVDYHTPLEQVAQLAVARRERFVYDDVLVEKEGKYYGTVSVKCLLEKTIRLELNRAKHASPLTGLPGNIMIEERLDCTLQRADSNLAVLYFDVTNLKEYNDRYGFEKGDQIICFIAELLQRQLQKISEDSYSFVGHIGGDDFIVLLNEENAERYCQAVINAFDQRVGDFYGENEQGYEDSCCGKREGAEMSNPQKYPLMNIHVGIIRDPGRKCQDATELLQIGERLKIVCKSQKRSCYIEDSTTLT